MCPHNQFCEQHKGGGCATCCAPDELSRDFMHPKDTNAIWKLGEECELYAPETKYIRRATILARNGGAISERVVWRILFRSNVMMYDACGMCTDAICSRDIVVVLTLTPY